MAGTEIEWEEDAVDAYSNPGVRGALVSEDKEPPRIMYEAAQHGNGLRIHFILRKLNIPMDEWSWPNVGYNRHGCRLE